jgi:serine/threonine protein kinase
MKKIEIFECSVSEALDIANEAITLAKLNHPYIIKYFDSFHDERDFCIITDFCDVRNLYKLGIFL